MDRHRDDPTGRVLAGPGAVPGSYVLMRFPELEASELAKVKSLAACPTMAEGDGHVVTSRIVTRQVAELFEIEFGR